MLFFSFIHYSEYPCAIPVPDRVGSHLSTQFLSQPVI
jgi:hypothetical protein